jgi:hypothetical protein
MCVSCQEKLDNEWAILISEFLHSDMEEMSETELRNTKFIDT